MSHFLVRRLVPTAARLTRAATSTASSTSAATSSRRPRRRESASASTTETATETALSDKDTFGSLSTRLVDLHEQSRIDDSDALKDDDDEEAFRERVEDTFRPKPVDYLRQMNDLVAKRNLRAALNLLDVDMKRYVEL